MCGEFMKLETRESVTRVPGTTQDVKSTSKEWVCRECDYFEEDDSISVGDDGGAGGDAA